MSKKISVLDIEIDKNTAKESMKKAVEYMESDPVNIIEMMTADSLMQIKDTPGLKEDVCCFDLVLAGDKAILEAAQIEEGRYRKETEEGVFLKMFMRYLHKNHKRIYLLTDTEEHGRELYGYIGREYRGIQIIGMAKVSAENRADDMLVNAINGGEIDCVVSTLTSPLQEIFVIKNKSLLNARIWLGLGADFLSKIKGRNRKKQLGEFVLKWILRKEIEKSNKKSY